MTKSKPNADFRDLLETVVQQQREIHADLAKDQSTVQIAKTPSPKTDAYPRTLVSTPRSQVRQPPRGNGWWFAGGAAVAFIILANVGNNESDTDSSAQQQYLAIALAYSEVNFLPRFARSPTQSGAEERALQGCRRSYPSHTCRVAESTPAGEAWCLDSATILYSPGKFLERAHGWYQSVPGEDKLSPNTAQILCEQEAEDYGFNPSSCGNAAHRFCNF